MSTWGKMMAMLEIEGLNGWYGASHVLHGVSFAVEPGEIVALVGRNGAGKTSIIRSIMGLMPRTTGVIRFDGEDISRLKAHDRYVRGLAYVPEERRIVRGLTVLENLQLGLVADRKRIDEAAAIDEIARSFPV